ncbi:MAG: DUF123 domain-containing protein [Candidatus Binatia bacterium]
MVLKGCYTLVIDLERERRISIGKLGSAPFPKGAYLYTGSALNSLSARLSRHLRKKDKRCHWHIDYLLKHREAQIINVLVYPSAAREECHRNQQIAALPGAQIILKGFGASDCISGCGSHLIFFSTGYQRVIKLLNSTNQSKKGMAVFRTEGGPSPRVTQLFEEPYERTIQASSLRLVLSRR